MADFYTQGQQLGGALFGGAGSRGAGYARGVDNATRVQELLWAAEDRRHQAMERERQMAARQRLPEALRGQGYAENEVGSLVAALEAGYDPTKISGYRSDNQEIGFREDAVAQALAGNWTGANANMIGVANGPVALAAVQGQNLLSNVFAEGGGGVSTTAQGQAAVAADLARARASDASAANSYASAASTRQDMGGGGGRGGGKAPSGYRWTADGALEPIPGGPADKAGAAGNVQLPVSAVRLIRDDLDAMDAAGTMDAILGRAKGRIDRGELTLGRGANTLAQVQNWAGVNTESSRNYQSFMSDLNRARNESLRLNKGVQTEGDAQRAWDELIANPTDAQFVKQRIAEIEELNARAIRLRQANVDMVRSNYGAAPMDFDARARAAISAADALSGGSGRAATPAVTRAVNPATGQALELRNGQWLPVR